MEGRAISRNIYYFYKKLKFKIFNYRVIHKKYINKKLIVILFTIIFALDNKKVYAQIEINNAQNQITGEVFDQNIGEVLNTFIVDNKTYKIIEEGAVILESYKVLSDAEDVVIKNNVIYDGNTFEVRYVYVKAFDRKNNIRSLTIENNVIGFCDSNGNLINGLDEFFKGNQIINSSDFGNIKSSIGVRCFLDCSKLINLKLSTEMNNIGGHSFERCVTLKEIDLNKIKKFDGESSFAGCIKLKNIGIFDDELMELPARTFMECRNLQINSLENIKKLGNECFKNCRSLNKDILGNVEEIGEKCFYGCNFNELYLKKAKKIDDSALGGMFSLTKVKFGNSEIPILGQDISMGSSINEWIYPKDYINQEEYQYFLSKLKAAKVKWYPNYNNLNYKVTQDIKLNADINKLKSPVIARAGYEIEGWYKESGCINKVNTIADLGESIGSDIVIKNPELYAKWRKKEVASDECETEKENSMPSDLIEPSAEKEEDKEMTEEKINTDQPKKEMENINDGSKKVEETIKKEEASKTNDDVKDFENKENKDKEVQNVVIEEIIKSDIEKEDVQYNNSDKESTLVEEFPKQNNLNKLEIVNESNQSKETDKHKSKKRVKINRNRSFLEKLRNKENIRNYVKDLNIKNNNRNKDIKLEKSNLSSLDYKMTEDFTISLFGKDVELEVFNISYKDVVNDNMEISKSGVLGRIIRDGESRGIYLRSNDYFERDSIIEIKFKRNINLHKLYLYNKELRKFMLANDKLKVKNNVIRINTTSNKEYLITKFELNREDIAIKGWNKINNDWYYINEEGVLVTDAIIDGYTVGNDGKLI